MKLAVFGATGRTGILLVEQALKRGDHVLAFVRNADALKNHKDLYGDQLNVMKGDLRNSADVEKAVEGQDAVIVALGVPFRTKGKLCADATRVILPAMNKKGIRKFVTVTGITPDDMGKFWLPARMFVNTFLWFEQDAVDDKFEQEDLINAAKDIDHVIVRPPWLTDGERTGKYQTGVDLPVYFSSIISRADLAEFMLKCCSEDTYNGKAPYIHY